VKGWSRRAGAAVVLVASLAFARPGPPEEAERQYRVARRLAAEKAPGAFEELLRVADLDPQGALADDALVEAAALLGSPIWPEQLGQVEADRIETALRLLDRVIETLPASDRVEEARIRRALLRLEPSPLGEPHAARLDLLAAASRAKPSPWGLLARYALAFLDEREGRIEAARGGYTRLIVDEPASPVALRARTGLARILLREGKAGAAACLLEEAIEEGVPADARGEELRELAVRSALRAAGSLASKPFLVGAVFPGARAIAVDRSGTLLVADTKAGQVVEVAPSGRRTGSWPAGQVQALTVDPFGRRFAASGETVYRLAPQGELVPVAKLGPFARPAALATDSLGLLYVADRKGERIGVLRPGANSPDPLFARSGAGIAALACDGKKLLVALSRAGVLAEFTEGSLLPVREREFERPASMALDAAGGVAVLDSRAREIVRRGPGGAWSDRVGLSELGLEEASAIAAGPSGEIAVLDSASGRIVVIP